MTGAESSSYLFLEHSHPKVRRSRYEGHDKISEAEELLGTFQERCGRIAAAFAYQEKLGLPATDRAFPGEPPDNSLDLKFLGITHDEAREAFAAGWDEAEETS